MSKRTSIEEIKNFAKLNCLDNNIQLIRIPYTIKNIEEYLNNELQNILVFNW
jgi:hypothetical protein